MKKNLLTFLFVMVLVCGGALAVSAKTSSSDENSVAVSKKVLVAKAESKAIAIAKARALANSLKVECKPEAMCVAELGLLLFYNALYESYCEPPYPVSCSPTLAFLLIGAGMQYENCLGNPYSSKNTDKTVDSIKSEKSRDVTFR